LHDPVANERGDHAFHFEAVRQTSYPDPVSNGRSDWPTTALKPIDLGKYIPGIAHEDQILRMTGLSGGCPDQRRMVGDRVAVIRLLDVVGTNLALEAQYLQDELANATRLLALLCLQGFTFVALRHMHGKVLSWHHGSL
jgi:hypothetical protein